MYIIMGVDLQQQTALGSAVPYGLCVLHTKLLTNDRTRHISA